MKKFVVMSGGFHPFHAGHASLYQQAKETFPDATVLVCATNVQEDRPFPFSLKKKLAQLSGVPPKDFIEVNRQFSIEDPALAQRIGDPNDAVVIFVRSEKDRNEPPIPWRLGPDGKPPVGKKGKPLSNRLLDYPGDDQPLYPANKHVYMDYLKTVQFGPGITSASEIRKIWPTLNDKRKLAMVMSLYPATQQDPKLAQNVAGMFDQVMGGQQGVAEDKSKVIARTAKDLENPPKIMQHRAKRDIERDQMYTDAQYKKDDDDELFGADLEMQKLLRKAQEHYPTMPGKQKAFIKFVQRALQHSEEEDNQQDKEIEQIKTELNKIQQDHKKIMKVSENLDYLEEK